MSIKNMPDTYNVGITGPNPAVAQGIGSRMLSKAAEGLVGAATKHEERIKEAELKARLDATAKLGELSREKGGKLAANDYASVGPYDPKLLDNLLNSTQDNNINRDKTAAQIAHWAKMDDKERELEIFGTKRKLEAMYGVSSKSRSGSSKSGKSGKGGSDLDLVSDVTKSFGMEVSDMGTTNMKETAAMVSKWRIMGLNNSQIKQKLTEMYDSRWGTGWLPFRNRVNYNTDALPTREELAADLVNQNKVKY